MVAASYDHRQRAAGVMYLVGAAAFAVILIAALVRGPAWMPWVAAGSVAVLLSATWMFSSLRVEVKDRAVRVSFGPGWPRWQRPLGEIASWQAVRNRWWYGWGIRYVPGGWMFNVTGLDAVELTLTSGRKFRIGTDEPAALVAALDATRRA